MKLTRITKLRNHRVFRDFAWSNDLHSFDRLNVIYGWNGCGKTTLSSLLSLVEQKKALTEGEMELEFDGSVRVAGKDFATAKLPQVRVFNREFINRALQSVGGIAPIYFLGEDSAERQKQIEQLKGDLEVIGVELDSARRERIRIERGLDEFCRDGAKVVKELLITGNSIAYNNYDKRRFRHVLQGLDADAAHAGKLSDERKASLRSQKDAQPKPPVESVVVPVVDLHALAERVDALVNRAVVAQTLEELKSDVGLASWVQRGLVLHSGEHAAELCRFCRQPLGAERRAALEAHFNDAFARFQRDVSSLLDELGLVRHRVVAVGLPEASRFYDSILSDVVAARETVQRGLAAVVVVLDALIARLEAKRENPFAPVMSSGSVVVIPPEAAVSVLNGLVNRHNQISAQFKASVEHACRELEASYAAEAYGDYLHRAEALGTASDLVEVLEEKAASIQVQIGSLERTILEHRRPADELTGELRAYLGRDELRFEVKGNGYSLVRHGEPVTHLSEGEHMAIAFLYFLKTLQDKAFNLAEGVVVIDDPVSSLDANAMFSAFGYMKERTRNCGQLILLTHSFQFFRNIKNWFGHANRHQKKGKRPARFFILQSYRQADGSRASRLGPLDPLLQDHESEYHYLFKCVFEEARADGVGGLGSNYVMPNIARRLLEAFFAFRFPGMTGSLDWCLDRVVEKYDYDAAKGARISRLLNTYSHALSVIEPEHDLSSLSETRPVLRDVLKLMELVDSHHYQGLEKLVSAEEVAPESTSAKGRGGIVEAAS